MSIEHFGKQTPRVTVTSLPASLAPSENIHTSGNAPSPRKRGRPRLSSTPLKRLKLTEKHTKPEVFSLFNLRECDVLLERENLVELKKNLGKKLDPSNSRGNAPQLQCHICDKKYFLQRKLNNHIANKHDVEKLEIRRPVKRVSFAETVEIIEVQQHRCRKCYKLFNTYGLLRKHMKSKHKKRCKFICDYCNCTFADRSIFKLHIRMHCLKCSKLFDSRIEVMNHSKKCEKALNKGSNIEKHVQQSVENYLKSIMSVSLPIVKVERLKLSKYSDLKIINSNALNTPANSKKNPNYKIKMAKLKPSKNNRNSRLLKALTQSKRFLKKVLRHNSKPKNGIKKRVLLYDIYKQNELRCESCNYYFKDRRALQEHTRHEHLGLHQCLKCEETFVNARLLQMHRCILEYKGSNVIYNNPNAVQAIKQLAAEGKEVSVYEVPVEFSFT